MISLTELLLLIFLVAGILWALALVNILKKEFKGNDKLIWIIVVVFLPIIGTLLYFFVGRKQSISGKQSGGAP